MEKLLIRRGLRMMVLLILSLWQAQQQEKYGADPIVTYDESEFLISGQWYAIGPIQIDHWNVVGHLGDDITRKIAKNVLIDQAIRLKELPPF